MWFHDKNEVEGYVVTDFSKPTTIYQPHEGMDSFDDPIFENSFVSPSLHSSFKESNCELGDPNGDIINIYEGKLLCDEKIDWDRLDQIQLVGQELKINEGTTCNYGIKFNTTNTLGFQRGKTLGPTLDDEQPKMKEDDDNKGNNMKIGKLFSLKLLHNSCV